MKTRFDSSGRCTLCAGGWLCKPCQSDTQAAYLHRWKEAARAGDYLANEERGRIAARLELESDEAGTATQKAARMQAGENPIPRHFMICGK
jgi:hypothetical protein